MNHKLREILLVGFFMLIFIFFASKGIWIGIIGIPLLFGATYLLSPERCLIILFFCYFFKIAIPVQVLGWRLVYQWVLAFWVAINIARLSLREDVAKKMLPLYLKRAKTCSYLFLAALGSVMISRGAGIYRLGGDVIGGSQYILTILVVVGLLFSFRLVPSSKTWNRLFILFIVSPFFLFLLQFLVARGFFWIKMIFDVTAIGLTIQEEGVSDETMQMGRYVSLTAVSVSFLGIASYAWSKRRAFVYVLFVICAVMSAGFSGYRRSMLSIVIILSLYHLIYSKNKKKIVGAIALLGVVGVSTAYLLAPYLPFNAQRTLAFLPGINIDYGAYRSATGTLEWRIELWKLCLSEIPQYLLVGKGPLLSVQDTIENIGEIAMFGHQTDIIFRAHAYHSLILALLLDLGVPATLAYVGLIVYLGRYFFQLKQRLDGARHAIYCFLLAFWINLQLHQLYSTGLLPVIVTNLIFAMLLLIVGAKIEVENRDKYGVELKIIG